MRLLVISNMAHYRRGTEIVGHGATVRELDALSTLFDSVRHVACLHEETAPASALPYSSANIELVAVPPAGGNALVDKLDILRLAPAYLTTIRAELTTADAVHIRCPANVSLFGLIALATTRAPRRRWVKYAGNWGRRRGEPLSYQLQRLWLGRPYHRARVTVNGASNDHPEHVRTFVNPCLTDDEILRGRAAAHRKRLAAPVRLLFVGHLGAAKNPGVAIEMLHALRNDGVDAHLDIAGRGSDADLSGLVAMAKQNAASELVTFHGALPRERLNDLYATAHFVVLPSKTEGWPKVLSEGMAFGAVPIATAVGSIPATLQSIGAGCTASAPDARQFANAVHRYLAEPALWHQHVAAALAGATQFSFAAYCDAVRELLEL